MQTVVERMARVGQVAGRVGVRSLALEAGLPYSTVRSYAQRGWALKYLPACDALIAAADRLEQRRVALVAAEARHGLRLMAKASGVPLRTLRVYARSGWSYCYGPEGDALVGVAERLNTTDVPSAAA